VYLTQTRQIPLRHYWQSAAQNRSEEGKTK